MLHTDAVSASNNFFTTFKGLTGITFETAKMLYLNDFSLFFSLILRFLLYLCQICVTLPEKAPKNEKER